MLGAEIDQQVAARDQIHARERRVADNAVRREDAEIAHAFAQTRSLPPSMVEKALPAFGLTGRPATPPDSAPLAPPPARARRCRSRKSEPAERGKRLHVLAHQNAEREDLFARCAARYPDAHGVVGAPPSNSFGMTSLQQSERVSVAEEIGDVDQRSRKRP